TCALPIFAQPEHGLRGGAGEGLLVDGLLIQAREHADRFGEGVPAHPREVRIRTQGEHLVPEHAAAAGELLEQAGLASAGLAHDTRCLDDGGDGAARLDRKSTRLNSSHVKISYA